MTLSELIFIPAMGVGGAFFPADACTFASAKALDVDQVERYVVSCSDEPYLSGKAPAFWPLDVAQGLVSDPLHSMRWDRPTETRALPEAGYFAFIGGSSGADVTDPPPIPLPASGWLMLAALAGLIFTRKGKAWTGHRSLPPSSQCKRPDPTNTKPRQPEGDGVKGER